MIAKLLTEHHLQFLSCLKGGCRGSCESTHVKMPHFWKFHALVQLDLLELVGTVSPKSACLLRLFFGYANLSGRLA